MIHYVCFLHLIFNSVFTGLMFNIMFSHAITYYKNGIYNIQLLMYLREVILKCTQLKKIVYVYFLNYLNVKCLLLS